jgi:hypothetical protein
LSTTLSARPANLPIPNSAKEKTVSVSSLATAAVVDVPYKPSSQVSVPRSERGRDSRVRLSLGCILIGVLLLFWYGIFISAVRKVETARIER